MSVACPEKDFIHVRIVDNSGARPHGGLDTGAIGCAGCFDEVDRLIAALGVEDVLRAIRQVDGRDVALVVALVAGIAPIRHVEVARTARRSGGREG
jgi:hypothetical protein